MGFMLDRTYRLLFEDYPALEKFEVVIAATSVEVTMALRELVVIEDSRKAAEMLVEHMIEWNYGPDSDPWPLTVDSLMRLELALLNILVKEWYKAAVGVSAPLEPRSTDTLPALASVPTESP